MRARAIALVTTLAALALPGIAAAECNLFGGTPSCSSAQGAFRVEFGAKSAKTAPPPLMVIVQLEPSISPDCKMVKPVDPQFRSAMPVVTPDPGLTLPMRIVPVPDCGKKQAR
jgi:hypothetical protein